MSLSVLIPFAEGAAEDATRLALEVQRPQDQLIVAGPGAHRVGNAKALATEGGAGRALREAVVAAKNPIVVVLDPAVRYASGDLDALAQPLESDRADAVYGVSKASDALPDRTLRTLARKATGVPLQQPFSGLRAFRSDVLKGLSLRCDDEQIDSEILVKVSAQQFRMTEVTVQSASPRASLERQLKRARALVRYLGLTNDADGVHEGYNTLARMETAPRYNRWLGARFREHLGRRVLEVGAGIGTLTRELAPGLETLVALEVDPFYVKRLKNQFRDAPHVRPILSGVEEADWTRLRDEHFDTVVLSNVLEHIEDDVAAVRNFRRVLDSGGKLVLFVPALQALYGELDSAVGHFRRYSKERLARVLEDGGFHVEQLQWMNLLSIPSWFLNSRILGRRAMPPLQLRMFDLIAPAIATLESKVELPIGLGLFAVARAV